MSQWPIATGFWESSQEQGSADVVRRLIKLKGTEYVFVYAPFESTLSAADFIESGDLTGNYHTLQHDAGAKENILLGPMIFITRAEKGQKFPEGALLGIAQLQFVVQIIVNGSWIDPLSWGEQQAWKDASTKRVCDELGCPKTEQGISTLAAVGIGLGGVVLGALGGYASK